jgi:glucose-6-phosphate isomerase
MENLKLNIDKVFGFVPKDEVYGYKDEAMKHISALHNKTAKGSDFLGWVKLPSSISEAQFKEAEEVAASFKNKIDLMVVIGIGGSYLGAKAVIEALSGNFYQYAKKTESPVVLFAGQNIGEDYLYELLQLLDDKSYALTVISKSGTTTEPAIAFRLLKNHLEKKYGKAEAKTRIIAITDEKKGALRKLATLEGYKTFVIPDDVGGRYSVLTPVGLIAIAVAGFDIRQLVGGAKDMQAITGEGTKFEENPAAIYAATRNALLKKGKVIEILANFDSRLNYISEWWKQLYGESEGKENKGIFPASVNFTADLHSMGQFIQEGSRNIFETVISVKEPKYKLSIPSETANLDDLNYIAGKRIDEVNKMAELGVRLAHVDGSVPNIHIEIPKINEYYIGQLIYFFEIACGISGYILGVNPFDQPGVEAYKKNMFALLEKPGFEEQTKKIKTSLK